MSAAYMAIHLNRLFSLLFSFVVIPFCVFPILPSVSRAEELASKPQPIKTEPIKIGAIFSLTGYGAVAGQSELDAIEMAVADINLAGGVNGQNLEIVAEDNQSSLKGSINAFQKLNSFYHVPVILGPNWAEFSEVVAPLAEQHKVVMLTASGYTDTLTKNRNFVFTTLPQFEVHVKPLTDAVVQAHPQKIALLKTSNTYLDSISQAVIKNLTAAGLKITEQQTVEPGNTDYRSMLLKMKKEKVDVIIPFLLQGGELVSFFKQFQQLDVQATVYTHDILYDEILSKEPKLAEGALFFRYNLLAPEDFLNRYRERYRREPVVNVPKAYDNVFLLQQAIKNCGIESEKIRQCLHQVDYTGLSGRIRFNSSGNVIGMENLTSLYRVRNGKFTPQT